MQILQQHCITITASDTESKVEKLEDNLSALRTSFTKLSEIQDALSKQMDGINSTGKNIYNLKSKALYFLICGKIL